MSREARAESPPSSCAVRAWVQPVGLGFSGVLPANAPAFIFAPARGWGDRSIDDHDIQLRDQDQIVVPRTLEAEGDKYLVRPARVLRGTQLSVSYQDFCGQVPGRTESVVPVGPASALPSSIGTAVLREGAARYVARCRSAEVSMVVDVRMSPELYAYRTVVRWDITYNGRTWRKDYGQMQATDDVAHVSFVDTCDNATHRVGGPLTIAAHVAGAAQDPPPLQLTLDAPCTDATPPESCSEIDGGIPDASVSPDLGLRADVEAAPAPPGNARSSGCSTRPAASGGAPLAPSILVLLVLGAFRRGQKKRPTGDGHVRRGASDERR